MNDKSNPNLPNCFSTIAWRLVRSTIPAISVKTVSNKPIVFLFLDSNQAMIIAIKAKAPVCTEYAQMNNSIENKNDRNVFFSSSRKANMHIAMLNVCRNAELEKTRN